MASGDGAARSRRGAWRPHFGQGGVVRADLVCSQGGRGRVCVFDRVAFLVCEIVAYLSALSRLSVSGDSRFWRGFARQGDGEVMPGRT